MNDQKKLAVLSDAFEEALGERVDLTAWSKEDLIRVLQNPGAVFALLVHPELMINPSAWLATQILSPGAALVAWEWNRANSRAAASRAGRRLAEREVGISRADHTEFGAGLP